MGERGEVMRGNGRGKNRRRRGKGSEEGGRIKRAIGERRDRIEDKG